MTSERASVVDDLLTAVAKDLFAKTSWPTPEDEPWRRTDLRRLLPKGLLDLSAETPPADPAEADDRHAPLLPEHFAARVITERGNTGGDGGVSSGQRGRIEHRMVCPRGSSTRPRNRGACRTEPVSGSHHRLALAGFPRISRGACASEFPHREPGGGGGAAHRIRPGHFPRLFASPSCRSRRGRGADGDLVLGRSPDDRRERDSHRQLGSDRLGGRQLQFEHHPEAEPRRKGCVFFIMTSSASGGMPVSDLSNLNSVGLW
jgi:hypothetical protein